MGTRTAEAGRASALDQTGRLRRRESSSRADSTRFGSAGAPAPARKLRDGTLAELPGAQTGETP